MRSAFSILVWLFATFLLHCKEFIVYRQRLKHIFNLTVPLTFFNAFLFQRIVDIISCKLTPILFRSLFIPSIVPLSICLLQTGMEVIGKTKSKKSQWQLHFYNFPARWEFLWVEIKTDSIWDRVLCLLDVHSFCNVWDSYRWVNLDVTRTVNLYELK